MLHGIHGLPDGTFGSKDKNLISCFTYAIDLVLEEDEQLIKEKNISIKGVILKTNELDIVIEDEDEKRYIKNYKEMIEAVKEADVLVLSFCYDS